jgi:dienelactone hydrolase
MNDAPNPIARKTVLYDLPGAADVTVAPVVYRTAADGPLLLDVYYPPGDEPLPAVVIAAGFPDPGFERVVGCRFKDMGSTVSWARLIAASGMIAVTYTNREPLSDLEAVLAYVRNNAASLRIDGERLGLWASSGNGPTALSAVVSAPLSCAVLCYPYTLDVPPAAAKVGFATTSHSVDDLPPVPLFLARAGRDEMPQLNESLDRFIAGALARNLPVTVVNQPEAPHAFDLYVDSADTRIVVQQILDFLRSHLLR